MCIISRAVELTQTQKKLINRIRRLKKEKNAIILCHNYQRPEIYEVADFIGDSLELCRKAASVSAKIIVFSGVYFMAESAAVLNPGVKVLIPDRSAGCALSDMVTVEALQKEKRNIRTRRSFATLIQAQKLRRNRTFAVLRQMLLKSFRLCRIKNSFIPDKNLAHFVAKQVPKKKLFRGTVIAPFMKGLRSSILLKPKNKNRTLKLSRIRNVRKMFWRSPIM